MFWRLLQRAYPVLLTALLITLALPVWLTDWLPLTDYGSFLEQLDMMWRHDDPATAYPGRLALPSAWAHNTLSLRVASLLGPLVGTLVVAKLLLTFALVTLPVAASWAAQTLGRSRWLAFAFAPLAWSATMRHGWVDFAVALPLVFFVVGLARRFTEEATPRRVAGLLSLLLLLYFTHILAFLAGWALSLVIIATHLPWRRALVALPIWVAPLPLVGLFLNRYVVAATPTELGRAMATDGFVAPVWAGPAQRVSEFGEASMGFFANSLDEGMLTVLLAGWLLLLLRPRDTGSEAPPAPLEGGRRMARYLAVELLAACCVVAYLALPSSLHEVPYLAERYAVLALMFVLMLPRVDFSRGLSRWIGLGVVAISITYAVLVTFNLASFSRRTAKPLHSLVEPLPDGSRLGVAIKLLGAWPMGQGAMPTQAMGMHAVENGGVGQRSAALAPHNPIQFRWGGSPEQLTMAALSSGAIYDFDHILVDTEKVAKALDRRPGVSKRDSTGPWTLFDVVDPHADHEVRMSPGRRGTAQRWTCPRAHQLVGFSARHEGGHMTRIQGQCRRWQKTRPPRAIRGPVYGTRASNDDVEQVCPGNQVVVGFHGASSGWAIQDLGVHCAPTSAKGGRTGPVKTLPTITGGVEGTVEFDVRCPAGQVAVGFRVRSDAHVHAVGVACTGQR